MEEQPITFTQQASDQVQQIINSDMVPSGTTALRVFVAGGGCNGFQYGFQPETDDQIGDDEYIFYVTDDTKFVVDPLSMMYLDGSIVDFKRDVMSQEFIISNPNVTGQCGCGNSFSA